MNILIGKIGKTIKFKNLKINTGDDTSMILFSTLSRMFPEHNFYFCGPNDLKKLSDKEYDYIFPNHNVYSIYRPGRVFMEGGREIMLFDTITDEIKKQNLTFDFALLFTGYVATHTLCKCCIKPDGEYYYPMNAFKRYAGPYIHVLNTLGIPVYTIAEDPRYITISAEEYFNRERLVLTQMTDRMVNVSQRYITNYNDHTKIYDTPIPTTYAEVEKIFLMGIDKDWKDKIDVERKLKNTKNPKCIVLSNGHGTKQLNATTSVKDGRLKGYLEYIINPLKNTEYADTKIYGAWSDEAHEKYDNIINKRLIELDDEIADAKYSFVYSIIPGFVTIKPWEMIIKGLLPFIHPDYDKDRLIGLPEYLYVKDPQDFINKMRELDADDEKYKSLLKQCQDMITPELLDGSRVCNKVMSKICNDLHIDFTPHAGVPSIFNHFAKDIFDNTKIK